MPEQLGRGGGGRRGRERERRGGPEKEEMVTLATAAHINFAAVTLSISQPVCRVISLGNKDIFVSD